MNVSYLEPLASGWRRMKSVLFRPFDIVKWIVLGFAVWLAGLAGGDAWNKAGDINIRENGPVFRGAEGVADIVRNIAQNAFWLPIVGFIILVGFIIYGVLLWVSSRAKFVYLDDVVRNEARITRPWSEYGELADSLFKWRLAFTAVVFVITAALIIPVIVAVGFDTLVGLNGAFTLPTILVIVLGSIFLAIPTAYINLFLGDFVVPIMYRDGVGAVEAWGRFMKLLQEHFVYFLLYGLFILALHVLLAFAVILLALFTCCVGAVLLSIPYVGTVLLLPVWVTYRIYSVDFLAQFDPRYRLFGGPEGEQGPAS
jgi:hypothetical protein